MSLSRPGNHRFRLHYMGVFAQKKGRGGGLLSQRPLAHRRGIQDEADWVSCGLSTNAVPFGVIFESEWGAHYF